MTSQKACSTSCGVGAVDVVVQLVALLVMSFSFVDCGNEEGRDMLLCQAQTPSWRIMREENRRRKQVLLLGGAHSGWHFAQLPSDRLQVQAAAFMDVEETAL